MPDDVSVSDVSICSTGFFGVEMKQDETGVYFPFSWNRDKTFSLRYRFSRNGLKIRGNGFPNNGMLRHSLVTLEGCNLLWLHLPYSLSSFCLFGLNNCLPAWAKWGMSVNVRLFSPKRNVLALTFKKKGRCGKSLFPQSTSILNIRGVFEECLIMKNCGTTLERGRN